MDLELVDNGNGGDVIFNGNDLVVIRGLQNMPFIGMFGGNVESSTREFKEAEQRFDWWGNTLFLLDQDNRQYNSELERTLRNISLTSDSLILIEEAVKTDLDFMSDFADIAVLSVTLPAPNRVEILISITEPGNIESNEFIYIWDATKSELTIQKLNA